jgi:hypothetical protein
MKRGPKPRPLADRFADLWVLEPSGCWRWTAKVQVYGMMTVDGKSVNAHRISWELYRGPIPVGLRVLHRCDNPICVNPDHLFLGTNADNMIDMILKGRGKKAKLTPDDVRAIRADSRGCKRLARIYGVQPSTIRHLRSGKTWSFIQ